MQQTNYVVILQKGANLRFMFLKFIFFLRVIYWHDSHIAKAYFRCKIWIAISRKKMHVFSWCKHGVYSLSKVHKRIFIRIFSSFSPYILTEGRNFRTFLKENYGIALEMTVIKSKMEMERELTIILIVLMQFTFLNFIEDSMYILQFKQMVNLTVS